MLVLRGEDKNKIVYRRPRDASESEIRHELESNKDRPQSLQVGQGQRRSW